KDWLLALCAAVQLALFTSAFALSRPIQAATPVYDRSAPLLAGRQLDRDYFVGAWQTRNVEFGKDVEVIWTVRADGTLDYQFSIDGIAYRGSSGTWDFRDGTLHEHWNRPDGSTGDGRASIERIDDNTFKLTVIDNGHSEYRGIARIYHRLGSPQTVQLIR
ncbi:MAG: hypothetical protein JSS20_16185, partial [Proteobacteria bacterium]|nr:hypothetical protein [Pseudomonadota bacterium]